LFLAFSIPFSSGQLVLLTTFSFEDPELVNILKRWESHKIYADTENIIENKRERREKEKR